MRKPRQVERSGVAAVEFAVILPLMVTLLLGVWEVGRMVEVQQLLTNAVREGARQASTGVKTDTQVKQVVVDYLKQYSITALTSNVSIKCINNTSITDPTKAAQLDQFRVSIQIPFDNVRWILLKQITNAKYLNASADWYSMMDIPITVSSDIPLK